MKINEKLINLRRKKGWSQEQVANKLDISRQSVSKWELGTSIPDTNNIIKLSNIYGIEVGELIGTENRKQEKKSRKRKICKFILLIACILLIVYFGVVVYRYVIINNINVKFKEYKNLSNYKIELYDYKVNNESIIKETKSCRYYKDGIEKKIYSENNKINAIFYTNYNTNEAIVVNENNKTLSTLDITTIYKEKGNGINMMNPSIVYCNNNVKEQIILALFLNVKIESNKSEYVVKYAGQTIWIDKETALPSKSIYREDNEENRRIYNFGIEQTTDEEVEKINEEEYIILY